MIFQRCALFFSNSAWSLEFGDLRVEFQVSGFEFREFGRAWGASYMGGGWARFVRTGGWWDEGKWFGGGGLGVGEFCGGEREGVASVRVDVLEGVWEGEVTD